MHQNLDPKLWTGRIDSETDRDAFKWHQNITDAPNPEGLSILGFECDEGVKRNQGRIGAKAAPNLLKKAMANLPSHAPLHQKIFDAGTVTCVASDLEAAQTTMAEHTTKLLANSGLVLNLGGGHEIAWASYLGLANHLEQSTQNPKIGIINFDAHFDLRDSDQASSGTPFAQIAAHCQTKSWNFNYLVMGISETNNSKALFNIADKLNVNYRLARHVSMQHLADCKKQLSDFIQKVDVIYLTIDLDAFPAAVAPGVSAPATRGIPLEIVEPLIKQIVGSTKLKLVDIAEYNPNFDIDNRTANLAARLAFLVSK
ncbi:MAG: formimidoylglutamase [Rhizobiales bacterium]|nr:formimidoylglutamase [Hyphomicrobiales bacterium]